MRAVNAAFVRKTDDILYHVKILDLCRSMDNVSPLDNASPLDTDTLLHKLDTEDLKTKWANWTDEEKKKIIDIYLRISRKEFALYKLFCSM